MTNEDKGYDPLTEHEIGVIEERRRILNIISAQFKFGGEWKLCAEEIERLVLNEPKIPDLRIH